MSTGTVARLLPKWRVLGLSSQRATWKSLEASSAYLYDNWFHRTWPEQAESSPC